jgi:hypothetical protein
VFSGAEKYFWLGEVHDEKGVTRQKAGEHDRRIRRKITMASRFSARPAVAPTKLEDLEQRDQQLEPLHAGQRKVLEKCGAAQVLDRIRSATTGANSINKSST